MRQTQFVPLRRRRRWSWRLIPACALAFAGWGCQQPPYCFYYGYGAPPCATVVPSPTGMQPGTICDPPAQVIEGTTSSDVGNPSANVVSSRNSPRVVVSQPDERPRWPWRKSTSDDTLATTSVEGAVNDSTVK
jgi:hypothetical protein